jgi:arylsulfatase A-like enzyme
MTGLYGSQLGVKHNTQMLPGDMPVPALAEYLREAGYQTAGIGKTHWYIGSRIMPDVPIQGSKRGFEIRALARKSEPGNYEPDSLFMADDQPEWFAAKAAEQQKAGPGGESIPGYVGETSAIPGGQHLEGWLTTQALGFLDRQRDPERPFFLYFSLDDPHPGFHVPPGYEDRYDINDFKDNPPPEAMLEGHPASAKLADRWPGMTPEERRRSHLRYAALCTYVDDCFGRVLDKLEAMGELDNTFILFTSDHGDMMGDRGRVSKYCLYEGSVRVPFIMAGPAVDREGAVDSRHVELVDVLPTMLDAAGLDIPEFLPGVSLLSDFKRMGSFAEMHGRGYEEYQQAPAVMFRTGEWKIILSLPAELGTSHLNYESIRGELFNLKDDPVELVNRYDDPDCLAVRDKLTREALMHIMSCLGRYPGGPSRAKIRVTGPATKPDGSIW